MINFNLECKTSEFTDYVPLFEVNAKEFDLWDALYFAADVDHKNNTETDGEHYGKVLEAIMPILERKTESVKVKIDDIDYSFQLISFE